MYIKMMNRVLYKPGYVVRRWMMMDKWCGSSI